MLILNSLKRLLTSFLSGLNHFGLIIFLSIKIFVLKIDSDESFVDDSSQVLLFFFFFSPERLFAFFSQDDRRAFFALDLRDRGQKDLSFLVDRGIGRAILSEVSDG